MLAGGDRVRFVLAEDKGASCSPISCSDGKPNGAGSGVGSECVCPS